MGNRNIKGKIKFSDIEIGMTEFRKLGAKSVELTGGGNPLLYRDGKKNINDIIELCHGLGYEIGIITNSENVPKIVSKENLKKVKWIRISLIKLDEGKEPTDYVFDGIESKQLGFSFLPA